MPDLNGADLSKVDLRGANLGGIFLVKAHLSETNLSRVNLRGSILSEADLRGAELRMAILEGADLEKANLSRANLSEANLWKAKLGGANFSRAFLIETNLSYVNLWDADLSDADLSDANLHEASLVGTNLSRTNLREAYLFKAHLGGAILSETFLDETVFSHARVRNTHFENVDLSTARGLDEVMHEGPSEISISTLVRSKGKIPEVFLRQAGVPELLINNLPSLVRALQPLDYYTCFISYSSKDQEFADRLYADFQAKGVRCWFAPHDMKIGDKIRPRIDESIRLYDKLLLILSRDSVASQWVEHEVETAIGKELEGVPNVLFPIRLDEAVMESKTGWASHIRLTRHIGDFTNWKNHEEYLKAFDRLLRDLKAGE